MIALDANILLRIVVQDDARQLAIARDLVTSEATFVPLTVTLECEWVLRSFYKYRREQIAAAIDSLTDLGRIVFEHVGGVRWALDRLLAGADFADMIHIVQSRIAGASALATFDDGIDAEAGPDSPLPVRTLD